METKEIKEVIGDNGKLIDTDYHLEDFGDDLLPKIKAMPVLDKTIIHYSQYTHKRYYTGCTVMSAINAFATLLNHNFSDADISSIYDQAEKAWFRPWSWRPRGSGWNVVRKRWNNKYPNNKALMFTCDIFSEEFEVYINKLGIAGVSINVDAKYWTDVKADQVLDWDAFFWTTGHATDMMLMDNYICIDSVPKSLTPSQYKIPMKYVWWDKEKITKLVNRTNMRRDTHIIIMESRIKETDPVEIERLKKFKENLEKAISVNSELRHLTTQESERIERNRQNDYNRSKLAVVNSLLGQNIA